ncbi:MAG: PKD domain-containing protein, partial [Bacteroidetes bacterium]|nr:PKD domain-containing protein [Bacteroidota bacterium]
MKYFYRTILSYFIFLLFTGTVFPCNLPSISVNSATDNGNGTYTYTVTICLGVDVNWGSTTSWSLTLTGGNVVSTSGTWNSTYQYCQAGCLTLMSCNGSILSGSGACTPSGMNNTITCSGGGGGGSWLSPDDNDATCISQPNTVCDQISFTTDNPLTQITMNLSEGSDQCTYTVTNLPPFSGGGCTPPTASFSYAGSGCGSGTFDFTNTGSFGSSMGSPLFTYDWDFPMGSPNSSTAENPTNITWSSPGSYIVSLTTCDAADATCCATTTQTITVSAAPTVTISSSTNLSCYNVCIGSATASGSGGTSPYQYDWSNGTMNNATISNLCAGTYTVTVTDANNCTGTNSVTITQPPALIVTLNPTSPTCGLCNGQISASVSGGTGIYTYTWSTCASMCSSTITGLCAGSYAVTVTDGNGCTVTQSLNLTQPAAMSVTMSSSNITCNGLCNGSASASPSGGTTPYTYSWSGGGTNSNKTALCAGTYTVTVTDNKGCTITGSVTITQPPALTVSMANTPLSCGGVCTGTATATPSGGTGSYTYSWSTGAMGSNSISSLCAGTFTVTVTDANGCTVTGSTTVTQPAPVTVTTIPTNLTCNGVCNGSATASGAGGTSPYTYNWSNGTMNNATISNVCAGTYTVTVYDNKGCTSTATATITEPPAMTVSLSVTDINCNGQCTGSITATPSGGTSPYTYIWTTCASMCTNTIGSLCAGTYTVTVTD